MTTTATTTAPTAPYDYTASTGITLQIMRPVDFPDCTMGGISSQYAKVTLVGVIDESYPAEPGNGTVVHIPASRRMQPISSRQLGLAPPVVLVKRNLGDEIVWSLEPAPAKPAKHRPRAMAGGNYASCSDSRLGELMESYGFRFYGAIAVHDRYES